MCGISGYILKERTAALDSGGALRLRGLLEAVKQRGPDDEGAALIDRSLGTLQIFTTERSHPAARIGTLPFPDQALPIHDAALVQARYAVIDPSAGGHQPYVSQDGSVAAVFNGEIYNYLELKEELERLGVSFRTASDTEVLVEGYRVWRNCLWPKLNGFWAVVIYDRAEGVIVISRDRLGVAPLYFRETTEGFFFSSLIRPLADMFPRAAVSRDVLAGYIETGFKDLDQTTFFEGVKSFPAGSVAVVPRRGHAWHEAVRSRFWDLPTKALTEKDISLDEAARKINDILTDAVRLRLRSDIPVAFELSGGMDSSSVVAAAARLLDKKITTFTMKVKGRDEEPYARAMTRRYNLDYRVAEGIEEDISGGVLDFARVMEEPYDTPANYTHHVLLKRIKAEGFHVILTGAGGDEALAGYASSFWPAVYREARGRLQAEWHEFLCRFATPEDAGRTLGNYFRRFLPARTMFCCKGRETTAAQYARNYAAMNFRSRREFHIRQALLPYYLRSTDHYTMNIPLEHRFPFLDYRFVEFGLTLPPQYLFRGGWTKFVLRRAMAAQLPPEILWRRRKFGFPFDFSGYFKGRSVLWQPYLDAAAGAGVPVGEYGVYDSLARRDPALLWRMISVGVWAESMKEMV